MLASADKDKASSTKGGRARRKKERERDREGRGDAEARVGGRGGLAQGEQPMPATVPFSPQLTRYRRYRRQCAGAAVAALSPPLASFRRRHSRRNDCPRFRIIR